jgi:hypothetical protein
VPQWRGVLPVIAVVLVGYVLYSNVYPAPSFPYNLFPYILLAWLVVGLGSSWAARSWSVGSAPAWPATLSFRQVAQKVSCTPSTTEPAA